MELRVDMKQEDSEAVEILFTRYQAYCDTLGFLSSYGSLDDGNTLFDKKWEETIVLHQQLEKLKAEMDAKYHPNDPSYLEYYFDFDKHQLVYKQ